MSMKNVKKIYFRVFAWSFLLLVPLLISGCNSETLFKSNFDGTASGMPPSPTQDVGTVNIYGDNGSVLVGVPPGGSTGNWVQIISPATRTRNCSMQGNLLRSPGDGSYLFVTNLFIPSGDRLVASIRFEPAGQPVDVDRASGFLHIDFMDNNTVRIDDDEETRFGSFPRDRVFTVLVSLDINETTPRAHIQLVGPGAGGEADRDIRARWRPMARQFGAVRVWMGYPWTGTFYATNILVTKRN